MKKTLILFLVVINLGSAVAADDNAGHVATIYGGLLRDAFGACVHTIFYNPDTDALPECGEVLAVSQPVRHKSVVPADCD